MRISSPPTHELLPLRDRHADAPRAHRRQLSRSRRSGGSSTPTASAISRSRACSRPSGGRSRRPAPPASPESTRSRSRKRSAKRNTRSTRSSGRLRFPRRTLLGSSVLAAVIAFRGATLIDGTGRAARSGRAARGRRRPDRVRRAADREGAGGPAGGRRRRSRFRGKWIVPGLIDAHVHAESDADLEQMLRWGVTSVRLMAEDVAAAREAARRRRPCRVQDAGRLSARAHLHGEGRVVGTGRARRLAPRPLSGARPRRPARPCVEAKSLGSTEIKLMLDDMAWCRAPLPAAAEASIAGRRAGAHPRGAPPGNARDRSRPRSSRTRRRPSPTAPPHSLTACSSRSTAPRSLGR